MKTGRRRVVGKGTGKQSLTIVLLASLLACADRSAQPQQPVMGNDACSSCRMVISDVGFAAQIVAPGEEPRFFDDLGCLRDYLAVSPLPGHAIIYVADHRTHAWIEASRAVFVSAPAAETPMGSHLAAYADEDSRKADAKTGESTLVPAIQVLGSRMHDPTGQAPEGGGRP